MEFHIGQVFQGVYPPEAADWCNSTQRAYIVERDAVDGERQFEIVAVPEPTLEELKIAKKAQIDAETSAAILSGFDYAVDGVTYHFSYDAFDQQNFADTANVCIMKQAGMPGLPDSVMWNAYTVPGGDLERLTFDASGFLALYAGGAMKHKNGTMQRGGERKAAVEAAATAEEVEAA